MQSPGGSTDEESTLVVEEAYKDAIFTCIVTRKEFLDSPQPTEVALRVYGKCNLKPALVKIITYFSNDRKLLNKNMRQFGVAHEI